MSMVPPVALVVAMVFVGAGRVRALAVRRNALRRLQRGRQRTWSSLTALADRVPKRRRDTERPSGGELAGMLDGIARRCAAGESLAAAFATVASAPRLRPSFGTTIEALRQGLTLETALARRGSSGNDADTVLATHVLSLCAADGGAVSESLDRAASTLRERDSIRRERSAQGAQARLSAWILTVLPIAFAAWSAATSSRVLQFIHSPVGVLTTSAGVVLNIVGWQLMNRSIRGSM